jgi:hypothetical protein
VINTSLFSDPSDALDLHQEHLVWIEQRLHYARHLCVAQQIFVFGHHPWFLYDEDEQPSTMSGASYIANQDQWIPDSYFHIPLQYRRKILDLFHQYNVTAAFAGHFHQNLVSRTNHGMHMIITSSLSMILESTGKSTLSVAEPSSRGIRVVHVVAKTARHHGTTDLFRHEFHPLMD